MTDPDFDLPAFAQALDLTRSERGMSWRQVAREAGVSASTLTRVQQGASPDIRGFSRLARWLRCGPAEFLGCLPASANPLAAACRIIRADVSLAPGAAAGVVAVLRVVYGVARG